ncbi:MAG: hypothetical protein U0168_19130 [Nannocystaceae bacterium]
MSSELSTLRGWVTPYTLLKDAVIVAARTLAGSVKAALLSSGPALPIRVRFTEPERVCDDDSTTRRIVVRPEDGEHLTVELLAPGSDIVEQQRTVVWDEGEERPGELITAIRELAGLE